MEQALSAIAKTSAFHRASAALLDVMSVLEKNIAAFDVETWFEVSSDEPCPSVEDEATGDGSDDDLPGSALPYTETYAVPVDRASSARA